jgi:mediator of RNA polymerase II transcription subunit 16
MPLYRAAIKDDDKWTYPFTQYETRGPFNPFPGKPSFVAVTRGGYVKLCYQDPSNAWQDVKHELDGFTTSADLLTHAFLCQDKGL